MTNYNQHYNAIFVNVPRTASSSMSRLVSTGGHRPLKQRRDIMYEKGLKEEYDNAFKFGFVRDPYDRFRSAMYHIRFFDINDFMQMPDPMAKLTKAHHMLFMPQLEHIGDDDNNILLDFVGRYENIEEDWQFVADKLGITDPLRHLNKSDRVTTPLNQRTRDIVYDYYKDDFEVLGYER